MSSYETVYLSGIQYGLRQAIKDKNISQEARAEQSRLSNDREQLRAQLFRTRKELELAKVQSQDQLRSVTRQWTEETTHLKEQIVKQSVSANIYITLIIRSLSFLGPNLLCRRRDGSQREGSERVL